MSATNRGAVRREQDHYETPTWLTEAIIPILRLYNPSRILEPAAGGGAIVRVLQRSFPDAAIDSGDIATGQDFLVHDYSPTYDLIITNPPYSLALEFIQRGLELRRTDDAAVCMLLRLNFLGSQSRAVWLRRHTPSVHVSPRCPSFTGDGTDATEYCWAVWDGRKPTITILPTESDRADSGQPSSKTRARRLIGSISSMSAAKPRAGTRSASA